MPQGCRQIDSEAYKLRCVNFVHYYRCELPEPFWLQKHGDGSALYALSQEIVEVKASASASRDPLLRSFYRAAVPFLSKAEAARDPYQIMLLNEYANEAARLIDRDLWMGQEADGLFVCLRDALELVHEAYDHAVSEVPSYEYIPNRCQVKDLPH